MGPATGKLENQGMSEYVEFFQNPCKIGLSSCWTLQGWQEQSVLTDLRVKGNRSHEVFPYSCSHTHTHEVSSNERVDWTCWKAEG